MRSVKLYKYQLPMDSGVILRSQRLSEREGWIIELRNGDAVGRGEVAPLPEFSVESAEQAGKQLKDIAQIWCESGQLELSDAFPSVAFGLSMALLELNDELPEQGNFTVAPLCSGDPDELMIRLNKMEGQKVAKIKVGMYEAVRDGMVANMFLEAIPDLMLRLDANRGWTPIKAQQFAKYVQPQYRSRIDFLEEPCKTPQDSLHFAHETGIAIAWDETVRDPGFQVEAQEGVAALVIKPTLIGSVQRCCELIDQAHQLDLSVVISSSLESSFGLQQLARFAHWKTPGTVPGLDTISLFKLQLETPWPGSELPIITLDDLEQAWLI